MGAPLQSDQKPETNPHDRGVLIGILAILFLLVLCYMYRPGTKEIITDQKKLAWDDVAYIDEHGEPKLKEWRLKELDKKIKEFEEAEQYALIAKADGQYICYVCNSATCFLQKGMVWKYGVTRRGVDNRYPRDSLFKMNLYYQIEFQGTHQECLIEEKRKIFLYPLYHDNLVRKVSERMLRPPGNKNDS